MKKFFVLLLFFIAGFCYGNEADDIDELMVLFNEGNEEAILTKAEKILSVESCSNDAKYNVFSILNEFYYRKRDYILAWKNAMKMIDCDPYNGYGYFRAGDILLILHNQVEACEYLSKAIELDPTQPNYHLARGMAKYELFKRKFITNKKNIEKNELYYDELLKIFDDFAEEMILDTEDYYPIYMGGLLLAFYIDENLPDYKELIQNGISLLNKAIRLNPNFINPYFVLASVYGSQKCYDIEKCYQNANKYIELFEDSIKKTNKKIEKTKEFDDVRDAMYFLRGNYYLERGNYELALKDYDTAISLNPSKGIYYFNKIKIYRLVSKSANKTDKRKYEKLIKKNMKLIKEKDPDFNK